MAVTDQTKKVAGTAGDSSNTTFSFSPMVIYAASELEVVTTVVATGVETVRSQGTGGSAWSIGITSFPATGNITYPEDEVTPLASTHTLTIRRKLTLEQQTDLENRGGYDAEVQETQFDKLLMIDLQQQEELDRCLRLPVSYVNASADGEITTPLGSDIRYLAFSAARDEFLFAAISVADASAGSATPNRISTSTGSTGSSADFAREDHTHQESTVANTGTSTATSVVEYGDSLSHTTVLTATALALPAITEGANTAVGDLVYTFPAGAIVLEWSYLNLSLNLDGTDQDAITAEIGLGTTIATGAVARLASTPGFEDILAPRDVLCDGVAQVVQAKVPTNGGPMFIASGDDHTVHVNMANGAAVWAAQSDGDGTSAYTGTVILHWKFLE